MRNASWMGFDDPALRQLADFIRDPGWGIRHVGADGSGSTVFSYTVGLTALGHPEIVVTGLPFDVAQSFLNLLGSDVKSGLRYLHGQVSTDLTENGSVAFIRVDDVSGLTAVEEVYGKVKALQMVWADSAGSFPWHQEFRNDPAVQPLLGVVPQAIIDASPDTQ